MPAMPRIVIDPGHGGTQALGGSSPLGCRGPSGTLEKDVNLRLAERVASYLGGDVALTRSTDVAMSLADRAEVAKRAGASIFLSLHANSGPVGARGSETFVHSDANGASAALGEVLQRRLAGLGGPNRGLKTARFGVLRPDRLATNTAACLLEVDFLSDPAGERRLTSAQEVDTLGRAIADGVREHLTAPRATYGTPLALFERYRTFGRAAMSEAAEAIAPRYNPSSAAEAFSIWADWIARSVRFSIGVEETAIFPHSAICKLRTRLSDGRRTGATGFFIAPNRILTAGHVVRSPGGVQAVSMEISPGMTNDQSTYGTFTVSNAASFVPHPSYNPGAANSSDFDLAVVVLDGSRAPNGEYFQMDELRQSPGGGIIVCGYAGEEVDSTRQHLDVDTVRNLMPETLTYALQTRHGTSGSPAFYADNSGATVVGVHSAPTNVAVDRGYENMSCRLTDAKIRWIRSV